MMHASQHRRLLLYGLVSVLCLCSTSVDAVPPFVRFPGTDQLGLLTWNVESGGSDPAVIAEQLAELRGYHIYGLTEVDPAATRQYLAAVSPEDIEDGTYGSITSVTG